MGYQKDLDAAAEAKDVAKMKEMSELIACLDQTMKEETAKNFDARPSSSTRPSDGDGDDVLWMQLVTCIVRHMFDRHMYVTNTSEHF